MNFIYKFNKGKKFSCYFRIIQKTGEKQKRKLVGGIGERLRIREKEKQVRLEPCKCSEASKYINLKMFLERINRFFRLEFKINIHIHLKTFDSS